VLAFSFVSWNLLLLFLMCWLMPKNDFGRTFYSVVAFLRGQDMYAMNESVPWKINDQRDLGPSDAAAAVGLLASPPGSAGPLLAASSVRAGKVNMINLWNLNPPHFHLLLLPLAPFNDGVSLALWCALAGVCLFFSLRWIVQAAGLELTPWQRQVAIFFLLGFVGTGTALVTGHLSFQLFLVVTLMWTAARQGRWNRAGVCLGLGMSIKPFLLILIPYLLLKRRWGAVACAGAAAAGFVALGLLVFGVDSYVSWRNTLAVADTWAWLPMNASVLGMLSRTFSPNMLFGEVAAVPAGVLTAVWLAVVIPVGLVTLAAALPDSSPRGVDRALALLLVAALLVSPLGWTYYFWLPLGPVVALAAAWWRDPGSSLWSRRLLTASVPGMMLPLIALMFLQRNPVPTVVTGSIYLWSLVLLWSALVIDAAHARRPVRPTP
jgi:hypothetical protein